MLASHLRRDTKGHANREELEALAVPQTDSVCLSAVAGSTADKGPRGGWLAFWKEVCGLNDLPDKPKCCALDCNDPATGGGHVWLWGKDGRVDRQYCYIAGVCSRHNNHSKFDWPLFFETKAGTHLMRMLPHVRYTTYKYDMTLTMNES